MTSDSELRIRMTYVNEVWSLEEFYFFVVPPDRTDPVPMRFLNEMLARGVTLAGDRFEKLSRLLERSYDVTKLFLGATKSLVRSTFLPEVREGWKTGRFWIPNLPVFQPSRTSGKKNRSTTNEPHASH